MAAVSIERVTLPDFGVPAAQPALAPAMLTARLERFRAALHAAGLAAAVIFADREHMANFAWLTGWEPRFEEALLVVTADGQPTVLAGPENRGISEAGDLPCRTVLYPPFGLLGQDRSRTPKLADALRDAGIGAGARIGVLGWKYYSAQESDAPETWSEAPSYIVDTLRTLVGGAGRVVNANALLMHPSTGLRTVNEIDQIAWFEFSACQTSEGIKRVVHGVRPGMTEFEVAMLMRPMGVPLNCPMFVSSGPRARFGLCSPTAKVIERGEPFTAGYGVVGALNCRAGWLVENAAEFPPERADYIERLAIPYFRAAQAWYATIGIGVTGGEIDAVVKRHVGDPFFGVFLNPGHLLHLDEWLSTPVYPGSTETFRSGQMVQCDIIPATGGPYFTINIEDGIALLDAAGREEFSARHPEAWKRVQARRRFMTEVLGFTLRDEVMPLGNIAGWLPPFLLEAGTALVGRG